jgi:hypothetical protein
MLSTTNPPQFVELAKQALSSISSRNADSPASGESHSDAVQSLADKLAGSGHRVLTKLIDEIEQMSPDTRLDAATTERIINAECAAIVEECLTQHASGDEHESAPSIEDQGQRALHGADVDLLQCGYDRRTLIVTPRTNPTSETIDSLLKVRPSASVVSADVEESVVICEATGISVSSFARGMERVYPGIAEAAGRHFTRIDIDWSAWSL